jgi:hypothetical protein
MCIYRWRSHFDGRLERKEERTGQHIHLLHLLLLLHLHGSSPASSPATTASPSNSRRHPTFGYTIIFFSTADHQPPSHPTPSPPAGELVGVVSGRRRHQPKLLRHPSPSSVTSSS